MQFLMGTRLYPKNEKSAHTFPDINLAFTHRRRLNRFHSFMQCGGFNSSNRLRDNDFRGCSLCEISFHPHGTQNTDVRTSMQFKLQRTDLKLRTNYNVLKNKNIEVKDTFEKGSSQKVTSH